MNCNIIDKELKQFLYKSFSAGHHNAKYTQTELGMCLISCANARESFEEGVRSPSPQTMRDRLQLDNNWNETFSNSAMKLARYALQRNQRQNWHISVDETHDAFFGDVESKKMQPTRYISGFRNDVKGATGSFEFLVVSLSCKRYKIPLFCAPVSVGTNLLGWLKSKLTLALKLVPNAPVLADRGFGYVGFLQLLEDLKCHYVVRVTIRSKKVSGKFKRGYTKVQYFMKEAKSSASILVTVYKVMKKEKDYYFVSNLNVKPGKMLSCYMLRWDIENIFKLTDRALLKTSSSNHKMRLFCLIVSFFLYLIWQFDTDPHMSLRTFVKKVIDNLSRICKFFLNILGRLIPS
jgi:hypothetical protein